MLTAIVKVYKSNNKHGVLVSVGVQTFEVNSPTDEGEMHAFWLAGCLARALENSGARVDIQKEVQDGRFSGS